MYYIKLNYFQNLNLFVYIIPLLNNNSIMLTFHFMENKTQKLNYFLYTKLNVKCESVGDPDVSVMCVLSHLNKKLSSTRWFLGPKQEVKLS